MKKKKFDLFGIFIFFTICIESIYFSVLTITNDTFYTIKIGEFIRRHGIDFKDHYSFVKDLSYTYPHWLYDVFVSKVYDLFGFSGLYIMNIIFYILLVLTIYFVGKKLTNNRLIPFLYSLLSCYYLRFFMVTRAQQITTILFILFLYFLYKLVIESKKKYGIFCFIVAVLVANLHCAVWPFIFILFLPFFGECIIFKIIEFIKNKKFKIDNFFEDKFIMKKEINFKYLIIVFIACVLSGLITPIRLAPYTYLIKTMMGNSQDYIIEHKAITLVHSPFQLMFLCLFTILLFVKSKFKFRELFMILGLFYLCLSSSRHLIFLITIAGIYILIILLRLINSFDTFTLDFIERKISKIYIFIPILVLLGFITYNETVNYKKVIIPKSMYPVDSLKWIEANLDKDNVRMYSPYDTGSYLLFNDYKVLVDSRADLYTPEFNKNCTVLDDYFGIEYSEMQEKYDLNYFLVYTDSSLYNYLSLDSDYEKIYSDKFFTLFSVK